MSAYREQAERPDEETMTERIARERRLIAALRRRWIQAGIACVAVTSVVWILSLGFFWSRLSSGMATACGFAGFILTLAITLLFAVGTPEE